MNKRIHVLSNTHWDREWYMSLENYRFRLVKMMDRLLDLMERQPSYTFVTDGQYMLVEDYLLVRPEMEDRVKQLVQAGRLLVGPWYTQPLETLVTGEAMVRNLLLGIQKSQGLGQVMRFAYMVDEFGHASQMPQVLQGFGIAHMMAWRGMGPDYPTVFTWRAPDGTAVTMHRSMDGYGEATALPATLEDFTEEFEGLLLERQGLSSRIAQIQHIKERTGEAPVQFWLNGIDHSWAQENLQEVFDAIEQHWPQYSLCQSTPDAYAADLERQMEQEGYALPVFTGELMNPDAVLMSTHSCRADHKLAHYRAEHLLAQYAEPMAAFAWLLGDRHETWAVQRAWKNILENHAHDSLGCCSVDSVYLQCMARYDTSQSISRQLFENGFTYLMALGGEAQEIYVYYPNATPAGGGAVVTLDIPEAQGMEGFRLWDAAGNEVPYGMLGRQKVMSTRYNPQHGHPTRVRCNRLTLALRLPHNAGIGIQRLRLEKTAGDDDVRRTCTAPYGVMENDALRVEIQTNGAIALLDKRSGRRYANLLLLEDEGECGTFYLHRRPLGDFAVTSLGAAATVARLAENDLLSRYEVTYTLQIPAGIMSDYTQRSPAARALDVRVQLTLFRDRPRLDVQLAVTNRSDDHQLRVLFPTGLIDAQSHSGQPFDIVERGTALPDGWDVDQEPSVAYHPMQDFCGAFTSDAGLAVAAKGVYEYELTPEGVLALTLLRAVDCIDRFEPHRQTGFDTQLGQLHKTLTYDLCIFPHDGALPYDQIQDFIHPPVAWYRRSRDEALLEREPAPQPREISTQPFVSVSHPALYVTMVKKAEEGDALVVRVLNLSHEAVTGSVCLSSALGTFGQIAKVNLEERFLETLGTGSRCQIACRSKEVTTLRFER